MVVHKNALADMLNRHAESIDPKQLWKRYTVALVLILALIVISHTVAQREIDMTYQNAGIINESGKQRMRSQRILYFALMTRMSDDPQILASLQEGIDGFENAHGMLSSRTDMTAAEHASYFDATETQPSLNTLAYRFIDDAQTVASGQGPRSKLALERMMAEGPTLLLQKLDATVRMHELQARMSSARLSAIQAASLILALAVIVLEALLIFLPAHISIRRTFDTLLAQTETLRRSRRDAARRKNQLADLQRSAEHHSLHDSLTGLSNRHNMRRELDRRAAAIDTPDKGIAVMRLDIDRFRQINETLGHAAGDFILRHLAQILAETVDNTDFVARTDGDEFVIVSDFEGDCAALEAKARHIAKMAGQPIDYEGELCSFSTRIKLNMGIDSESGPAIDPDRLLTNADAAMKMAKEIGSERVQIFNEALRKEMQHAKELSDDIVMAISRREFFPVYQAQVCAATKTLNGLEALARWRHPDKGEIPPYIFLPIAERAGLTPFIDQIILDKALADLRAWDAAGVNVPRLSVNVSANRLNDPELIVSLKDLDIPRGRISFEVLESVMTDRVSDSLRFTLDCLEEMGIDIEIDDFGTGHASLVALMALRPKRVKIARELVSPIDSSTEHFKVLTSVMEIAKSLDMEVVAEGVETAEQARMLCDMKVQTLQGFHFCRPVPKDRLTAAVARGIVWGSEKAVA